MDASCRLRRSSNATFETVADEAIVIHLRTGAYYSLNEVGTVFWQMLDGSQTIGDCAAKIAGNYDAPVEVIAADLLEISADLLKEGLVETV
jgi:hypothetical protein